MPERMRVLAICPFGLEVLHGLIEIVEFGGFDERQVTAARPDFIGAGEQPVLPVMQTSA